ncbi:adenosine deaminase [Paenibacillus arenilitoris]|uniref:adenosine deaminase n=1 Tax=Paenibacillus arenilitoris TaxID=2772299 RepID=A0A927CN65_9BACL|nr:adenosine deaminase [Paenibacillus arenilitoris]MBD2871153.1 adenosine deaminase [Paenibacillus arenilitoris]
MIEPIVQAAEEDRLLIEKLPKVDLHVHLDGSVKPETIRELAAAQQQPLPTASDEALRASMQVDEHCEDLTQYLSKFGFVLPYLQTGPALERVAYELVGQAAEQRVKYVEVRFAPQLHRLKGLSIREAIGRVTEGLRHGERTFGTVARAIAICMRSHSDELNKAVVEEAALFLGKGVVAVDLAGDEASFPPERFRRLFADARRLGLPITIHAGEAAGADNVREAVMGLGAQRIGHGVRMLEDPSVVKLVKEMKIPLEMCPLSNIQTKAVKGWEAYPIRRYMEQGIIVTVNTDNMTVSGTTIQKEFDLLAEHFGLTALEAAGLVMNGARAAFLEEEKKRSLIRGFEDELATLGIGPEEA